jgi:predicted Zn-dependent protease
MECREATAILGLEQNSTFQARSMRLAPRAKVLCDRSILLDTEYSEHFTEDTEGASHTYSVCSVKTSASSVPKSGQRTKLRVQRSLTQSANLIQPAGLGKRLLTSIIWLKNHGPNVRCFWKYDRPSGGGIWE